MKKFFLLIFSTVFVFYFMGCGEKKSDSPIDELKDKSKDIQDYADKMKETVENTFEGKNVKPVNFRELKSLLPENIGDLKRTSIEGERVNAMGMNISHADARYSNPNGNESVKIKITDLGSMSGLSGFAAYGWYMVDIDKETETGYEKTFSYKGYKGYEKYDNEQKDGELSVLVAKRFMVELDGNNISMDQMKEAVDAIDLEKLESWKNLGVEEEESKEN